jgi:hypothetical protein
VAQSTGTVVWFAHRKQIKRVAHRSTLKLETALKQYVEFSNDNPKPFNWTKTANQILAVWLEFASE